MKNGKILPPDMIDNPSLTNQSKLEHSIQSIVDNLNESESLEQDGVLVVNISTDNILNLYELYPNIQLSNISNKMDEVTNKIQSNSREITGDTNNLKFKDIPDNITVAPAPTNGVLSTNEDVDDSKGVRKTDKDEELEGKVDSDVLKPTESLQSLIEETTSRRRRRRRRHGNGRRYVGH